MTLDDLHAQLHAFALYFRWMRAFDYELRRATGRLPFVVRNDFAWESVLRGYSMRIIEFSEWVGMLHKKGLKQLIQGKSLTQMKVSKTHAMRLHESTPVRVVGDAPNATRWIRDHLVQVTMNERREAMRRLFGNDAVRRNKIEQRDVDALCRKLERRAKELKNLRNKLAHPFGSVQAKRIALHNIASRVKSTNQLLNDLGMLISDTTFGVPATEAAADTHCRDVVDLILFGTIHFATKQWAAAAPDAYMWKARLVCYRALRTRARKNPGASMNSFPPLSVAELRALVP